MVRARYATAWAATVLSCLSALVLAFSGCAATPGSSTGGVLAAAEAIALPPPSALPHGASVAGALSQDGSDYIPTLPNRHVTPGGSRAYYAPEGAQVAEAAYAIYRFDLAGFGGPQSLVFDWVSAWDFQPQPPCFWVGLSNWQRDRWQWLPVQQVDQLAISAIDPYVNPGDGACYAVLFFMGEDPRDLRGISIGQEVQITSVQPLDVTSDAPVVLNASVTGSAPLSYDWQFGAAATPGSSSEAAPAITPGAVGDYDCSLTVTNPLGAQTFNFTLHVGAGNGDWVHTYGDAGYDYPKGSAVDAQGNLIVSSGPNLTVFSPAGSVLASYSYYLGEMVSDDITCCDLGVDTAGNIYISGTYGGALLIKADGLFLLQLNSSYEPQWLKVWPGHPVPEGCTVACDASGNIWVGTSTSTDHNAQADVALLEFSPAGELLSQQAWGTIENEFGLEVALDSTGRVYLTAAIHYTSSGEEPEFFNETCLLLYDSGGNLLRQRGFPEVYDGKVFVPGDGSSVLLLLYSYPGRGGVASLDSSWNMVWSKYYEHSVWSSLSSLLLAGDALYLGGRSRIDRLDDEPDSLVLKCDLTGNVQWCRGWHRDDNYETCSTLLPAPDGKLYMTGIAGGANGAWSDISSDLVVSGGPGTPRDLSGSVTTLDIAVSDVSCERHNTDYTWDSGGGGWDNLALRFTP